MNTRRTFTGSSQIVYGFYAVPFEKENHMRILLTEDERALSAALVKPNIPENNRDFSPETPFITRYFTVTLTTSGEAISADVSSIAAFDENEAKSLAETLFAAQKTGGYSDDYKYASFTDESGVRYIFLDCSRDSDNFRAFLRSSAIISAIGFLAVTVLIAVLSWPVTKPAAEAYRKQKRFITDANHELKTPLTVIDASRTVPEMENGANRNSPRLSRCFWSFLNIMSIFSVRQVLRYRERSFSP